jgi:hypothetical protein
MSQHNDLLQTPLATAICKSDGQEVKRVLADEKAASTVFVKGSGHNSILCTLPNAPKPQSTVISHQPPLQDLPVDIVDVVDSSVSAFLNSLPQIDRGHSTNISSPQQSDSDIIGSTNESFRIGDIVRIAPSVMTSSLTDSSNMGMVTATEVCT